MSPWNMGGSARCSRARRLGKHAEATLVCGKMLVFVASAHLGNTVIHDIFSFLLDVIVSQSEA